MKFKFFLFLGLAVPLAFPLAYGHKTFHKTLCQHLLGAKISTITNPVLRARIQAQNIVIQDTSAVILHCYQSGQYVRLHIQSNLNSNTGKIKFSACGQCYVGRSPGYWVYGEHVLTCAKCRE